MTVTHQPPGQILYETMRNSFIKDDIHDIFGAMLLDSDYAEFNHDVRAMLDQVARLIQLLV